MFNIKFISLFIFNLPEPETGKIFVNVSIKHKIPKGTTYLLLFKIDNLFKTKNVDKKLENNRLVAGPNTS